MIALVSVLLYFSMHLSFASDDASLIPCCTIAGVAKSAFSYEFIDQFNAVDQLIDYVKKCHLAFLQPGRGGVMYYSPFVTIHQSSMAGKSRTALEAMKRLSADPSTSPASASSSSSSSAYASASSSFVSSKRESTQKSALSSASASSSALSSASSVVHCVYLNVRDEDTPGGVQTAYPPAIELVVRASLKSLRRTAWTQLIGQIRSSVHMLGRDSSHRAPASRKSSRNAQPSHSLAASKEASQAVNLASDPNESAFAEFQFSAEFLRGIGMYLFIFL